MRYIKMNCFMLIVFLSACDKEDSRIIQSYNSGLLYQVEFDSELFYEYTYNATNQVVEEKSKMHYTKHNYLDGKLISSDYYIDPRMYSSCSYIADSAWKREEWVNSTNTTKFSTKIYSGNDEGKIIRSENENGVCEYGYDDKNRIIRQTFYRDNVATGYIDFIYDENDNVIKRLHYWILSNGESELQTTTEYEFDDKINPYRGFSIIMIPGEYTNTNNIIKETYRIHFETDPSIDTLQVTENYYKYNFRGFPVLKNNSVKYIYY